ncbi:PqqD family protein [Nitratifractor sp.]
MDFSKKVEFSDKLFVQEVDGELVLLDMQSENYFGLDATASDIWRILQEGKTLDETVNALLEIYDVDAETLRKDLSNFVSQLQEQGLATLH